jgi:hypothetical protein
MRIPYHASNFPPGSPPGLSGKHLLNTTWPDIVWAAITAGKPGASHLLAHRWHSLADIVVRSHTIYANLRQRGARIDRSTLYDALDPTEKGATSYFLGMAMAKLFASELLDTPWLFHVSQATSGGASIAFLPGSKSQPDLIGQNSGGDWIVVEAKGRTNGLDIKALNKAKVQTTMIRTINAAPPALRVALQAYFDDELLVRLDDPSEAGPEALDVELDLDSALARYYSFANAISVKNAASVRVQDRDFLTRIDEDSGVTIGLQASVVESIARGQLRKIRDDQERASTRMTSADGRTAIYPDGLLVQLDDRWSTSMMSLEPEARDG